LPNIVSKILKPVAHWANMVRP